MVQTNAIETAQDKAVTLLQKCGSLLYGEFTLASGKTSDYYFDSKQLTLEPEGAYFVARQLVKKLEEEKVSYVGGTAYSAIPIVSHICLYSQIKGTHPIRAFYHRKETKGHGTNQLAEGKIPSDSKRVAIVEDVVTSGASLLEAIHKAEAQGCKVTNAIVLVDRNEGGREAVEERGYKFWALFTVERNASGGLSFTFNGYPIPEVSEKS